MGIQSDAKYTPVLSQRKLTDTVKDLLRSMLRIRPEQRAEVDECLEHEFFRQSSSSSKKLVRATPGRSTSNHSGSSQRHRRRDGGKRAREQGAGHSMRKV